MGAVYRATDSRLNRTVAIKILPPHAAANPDRQRRFVQEARSASALNHPNIVHIYDIDTADDVTFIAMEFVDGRALDAVIAEAPLPIAQVLDYAIQAAGALAAAHDAGIVHRDVKPANILVNRSGQVKVLDFGLAKLLHPAADTETFVPSKAPTPATAIGVVVGTPAYMSPEQAEGRYVDARSDVFAFGAVLYEMLSGRRAFEGHSALSIMAAVLHHQPTPLVEVRPGIPPALDAIVTALSREGSRQAVSVRRGAARRARGVPIDALLASAGTGLACHSARGRSARHCRAARGRRGHLGLGPCFAHPMGAPDRAPANRDPRRQRSARPGLPAPHSGSGDHPRRSATRAADQRRHGPDHARDDACGSRRRDQELPQSDWRVAAARDDPVEERARPVRVSALAADKGRVRSARDRGWPAGGSRDAHSPRRGAGRDGLRARRCVPIGRRVASRCLTSGWIATK